MNAAVHTVALRYPAPADTAFHPGAFDRQIGQRINVTYDLGAGEVRHAGTLRAAEVAEDGGRSVLFTLDVATEDET